MADSALWTTPSRSLHNPPKTLYLYKSSHRTQRLGLCTSFLNARSCSKSLNSYIWWQLQIVRGTALEQHKKVNWNRGTMSSRSFRNDITAKIGHRDLSRYMNYCNLHWAGDRRSRIQSLRGSLKKMGGERGGLGLNCVRKNWDSGSIEILDEDLEFERRSSGEDKGAGLDPAPALETEDKILGRDLVGFGDEEKGNNPNRDSSLSSTFDLLELKGELEKGEEFMSSSTREESDLVPAEGSLRSDVESKGGELVGRSGLRKKEVLRRSTVLAKQVISMHSALSLGFISQLWVDTRSWVVVLVEVRPSLLSGEMERFLLEDVCQVGDVVLVQDESVIENEFKMIGLDTLVGYNVVTPGRHNVGKVRGYTFNINSGALELLELDSFGISIIPASLVSTYGLPIDDVLEVTSDTVVVHEDAASRVQRLSKGLWDTRSVEIRGDELRGYSNLGSQSFRPARRGRSHNNTDGKRTSRKLRDADVEWELPMDF